MNDEDLVAVNLIGAFEEMKAKECIIIVGLYLGLAYI